MHIDRAHDVDEFLRATWDEQDCWDPDLPQPTIWKDGRIGRWVPHVDNRDAITGGHFEPASPGFQIVWGRASAWTLLYVAICKPTAEYSEEPF